MGRFKLVESRSVPDARKIFLSFGRTDNVLQLPLILSWAMSIHKSQGQTLERVRVDLGRVFEKGK